MIIADAKERNLALDPTQSFIVQAPAGSGKTELLTQRFLRLLSTVKKSPEEILAVTFTRKAAGEMRHRIISALKLAKNETMPEKPHERITWELARAALNKDAALHWNLLENPNRLRILTIDSLCSSLVNQSPLLSRMGMMPEITEDPDEDYLDAITALLQETTKTDPWYESLRSLLLHVESINALFQLLRRMLASRDQWLPYLGQIQQDKFLLEDYFNQSIQNEISHHLSILSSTLIDKPFVSSLLTLVNKAAQTLKENDIESPLQMWNTSKHLPDMRPEDVIQWEAICNLLLTQQNTWRKSFNIKLGFASPSETKDKEIKEERKQLKEQMLQLMTELEEEDDLLDLLSEVRNLPNYPLSAQQVKILHALGEVLPVVVAHLQVIFQQKGRVDFIEVALSAILALGESLAPSNLALRMDNQLSHILIDEYQDTSITQYRLFAKMIQGWEPNSGKTVFLVGDPMQSIYRFRGAEVSLFLQTQKEGLANIKLKPLTLTVNFRSSSSLVSWINEAFIKIFPLREDVAKGAVPYTPAKSLTLGESEQPIYIHPSFGKDFSVENKIIEIIRECQEKKIGTVGILARSKKQLFSLIQCMKQTNIPFVAHEVEQLITRSHVIDLLTLLRATEDLTDSIAWYALLRAPWLGLTLADLEVIAQNRQGKLIWQCLEEGHILSLLSEAGCQRLLKVISIFKYWFFHQKRQKQSLWLRGLWIALGGPFAYGKEFDLSDIDKILSLIDASFQNGHFNFKLLFEKLMTKQSDVTHLEQSENTCSKVEIMTIHKSKGLEFDCVILPYLHKRTRQKEEALLLWLEKTRGAQISLLAAPRRARKDENDSLFDYIASQLKEKDNHELNRLLYVGVTRAKRALHLLATVEQDEEKQIKVPTKGSFLALLWPHLEQAFVEKINERSFQEPQVEDIGISRYSLSRLKAAWQLPISIQNQLDNNSQSMAFLSQNIPQNETTWQSLAGTVFHRLMQTLLTKPSQSALDVNLSEGCSLALKRMGLWGEALQAACDAIVLGVTQFLSDPLEKWLRDESHLQKQMEWPIFVKEEQDIKQYIIDYSFVDKNNIRWIIDFKLSAFEMSDKAFEMEIEKYKPQLKKYYDILKQLDDREIKCGLYFPLQQSFKEIIFEELAHGKAF